MEELHYVWCRELLSTPLNTFLFRTIRFTFVVTIVHTYIIEISTLRAAELKLENLRVGVIYIDQLFD